MFNQLNKAFFCSFVILFLPSLCLAEAPNLMFSDIVIWTGSFFVSIFLIVAGLLTISVLAFFLLSLSKLLKKCDKYATMSPSLVWLNLIPIFNFGWMIYTVIKISESIGKKFEAHGVQDPNKGAKVPGLVYSISFVTAPFVAFTAMVGLIFWIMYWVKIINYNKRLSEMIALAATDLTGNDDHLENSRNM